MEDIKPKRVLSEAQRLAFLKGREKRMNNLEKKRLEKEEANMTAEDFQLPAAPPKPKKTRVKKEPVVIPDSKPEPEPEAEPKKEPTESAIAASLYLTGATAFKQPGPEPETKAEPTKVSVIDEDDLAARIIKKLTESMSLAPPKVTRRPRKTTKTEKISTPEPPTNNFSWL